MRQVGNLASQQDAELFVDYLLTQGVNARADASPGGFSVWAVEENDVERAKEMLAQFQAHPEDPRYATAQSLAGHLRGQKAAEQRKAQRQIHDMRERWDAPAARRIPVTMLLLAASIAASVLSDFGGRNVVTYWLDFSNSGMRLLELRHWQLWRLWTPMLLHGTWFHLLMNMYCLVLFGRLIEIRKGSWVLLGLVLATQLGASVAQIVARQPDFVGISGAICGLLGYVWMKSRYDPAAGLFIHPTTVTYMLAWLILAPMIFSNIASAAHFGGLVMGIALGYPRSRWLGK